MLRNTNHINLCFIGWLLLVPASIGRWRQPSDTAPVAVKRQCTELASFAWFAVEYRALRSSGWQSYNRVTESPRPQTNQERALAEPSHGTPPSERPPEERLDSWKEIAAHLHRDVTTVQRWEKREGMPVHRHQHDRIGSVYAFSSELDAWLQGRKSHLQQEEKQLGAATPVNA